MDDIRAKIHMRHEGAVKRERAIAYARSHQRSSSHCGRPSSPALSLRNHGTNRNSQNWSYLEGWMATKPWESRLMEQTHTEQSTNSLCSDSIEETNTATSKFSDASSVKIRRNNMTTRVSANPPSTISASSDFVCDASSPSTSSVTPMSGNNFLTSERRSNCGQGGGPSYMNWTKSAKARLSGSTQSKLQHNSRTALSSVDVQSTAGSEVSVTSKRLNSLTLKGRSIRSLDKENNSQPVALF